MISLKKAGIQVGDFFWESFICFEHISELHSPAETTYLATYGMSRYKEDEFSQINEARRIDRRG